MGRKAAQDISGDAENTGAAVQRFATQGRSYMGRRRSISLALCRRLDAPIDFGPVHRHIAWCFHAETHHAIARLHYLDPNIVTHSDDFAYFTPNHQHAPASSQQEKSQSAWGYSSGQYFASNSEQAYKAR
jgi:hypothetical protein